MTLRTKIGVFAALLIVTALGIFCYNLHRANQEICFRHEFGIMGTRSVFTFYARETDARRADRAALAAFESVAAACNLYDKTSELSQLNATAAETPFVCSDLLWDILCEARRAYTETNGIFDISVKPLMDLWGFYRKRDTLPSPEEIARTQALTGLGKVVFNDAQKSVFFPVKGMALDLGGIAKGFALDLGAQAARNSGVKHGLLDLGGNLFLLEPQAGKEFFKIGIKDPGDTAKTIRADEVFQLAGNCAVSTSGSYERFVTYGGKKYSHIIDPRTGGPSPMIHSATVVAPTAVQSDWMSTSIYLDPSLKDRLTADGKSKAVIIEP